MPILPTRFALLSGALALLAPAAAVAETAPGEAKARLIKPITLQVERGLSFGNVLPNPTRTSTVRVNFNGTVALGGGAQVFGADHHTARFTGNAQTGQVIQLNWPAQIFLTGPGPQMRVNGFGIGQVSGLRRVTGRQYLVTQAAGHYGFGLRGTLRVGTNQADGDYVGSFTVTADYQ